MKIQIMVWFISLCFGNVPAVTQQVKAVERAVIKPVPIVIRMAAGLLWRTVSMVPLPHRNTVAIVIYCEKSFWPGFIKWPRFIKWRVYKMARFKKTIYTNFP